MEKKYIIKILLALINQEIEIIIDNQPGKSYVRDFEVYNLVIRKKTVWNFNCAVVSPIVSNLRLQSSSFDRQKIKKF